MATPPDQLPMLLAALSDHDALGSRISRMVGHAGVSARLRQFSGLPPARIGLGSRPVQDTQCGFKGFTREAAQDLFARQRVTSIVFDVELIYLARRRGYRMSIVPIKWTTSAVHEWPPPGLPTRGLGPGPHSLIHRGTRRA
jgi:dolichyl-phosphate beta-glucosyltransferase